MRRKKETILFIIICVFLIFSIFSVRAKIVGKSSVQVESAVKFLNDLKEIEAINENDIPNADGFKEITGTSGKNLNSKYTIVAGNYGIDLDNKYNVIGFLDKNKQTRELDIIDKDKVIRNGETYLQTILDENVKFNGIKNEDEVGSIVYTLSFYKYHKKYISYNSEIIVQINKYTGKLVSYTGFSDDSVSYSSDTEILEDKCKSISYGYFEALGLNGELVNNIELGYFIVDEGKSQLCYILDFKIMDGQEKNKIYKVIINAKDGTVVKHY